MSLSEEHNIDAKNMDNTDKCDRLIEDSLSNDSHKEEMNVNIEKSITDMLESEKVNAIAENDANNMQNEDNSETESADSENIPEEIDEKKVEKKDEWTDLLGSGVIMKRLIKEGEQNTRPVQGQKCKISYVCKLEDDTVVERVEALEFNLGECEIVQGLDVAIGLMNVSERCILKIQPRLAYGEKGLPPKIPPNVTVVFEIQLLSVEPEEDIENMTVERRKEMGKRKKEQGNWWYKRGECNLAIQCYRRALDYLDEVEGGVTGPLAEGGPKQEITDADLQALLEDRISVCNNMAAAQLKLELYDQALLSLQTVLRCQPENIKALYRKAKVYIAKNDLSTALKCLERARDLQPDDIVISKEIQNVNSLIQKQKMSEKEYARRMFGAAKESTSNSSINKYPQSKKVSLWATIGLSVIVGLGAAAVYKFKYA